MAKDEDPEAVYIYSPPRLAGTTLCLFVTAYPTGQCAVHGTDQHQVLPCFLSHSTPEAQLQSLQQTFEAYGVPVAIAQNGLHLLGHLLGEQEAGYNARVRRFDLVGGRLWEWAPHQAQEEEPEA